MKLFLTVGMVLFFISCIKESLPECPYQYKIQLFVKDKNYANSSIVGTGIVDENLPFREYVSNIYYTLQDVNTGENIITPVENTIEGDEKETEIILDQIPDGEYLLTVWGNIETEGNSVEDPSILHENKEEDTDEYIASEAITIKTGLAQEKSLGLERIKGKLLVTLNNLPDNVTQIIENVTSVYQKIDNRRVYSQKADVEKKFIVNTSFDRASTFLAPTVNDEISVLSLSFYDATNNEASLIISPIEVKITRNEITAVNVNYNPTQNQVEIWVYIDNGWTLILELDIDDN